MILGWMYNIKKLLELLPYVIKLSILMHKLWKPFTFVKLLSGALWLQWGNNKMRKSVRKDDQWVKSHLGCFPRAIFDLFVSRCWINGPVRSGQAILLWINTWERIHGLCPHTHANTNTQTTWKQNALKTLCFTNWAPQQTSCQKNNDNLRTGEQSK